MRVEEELHIAGVVVHAMPQRVRDVAQAVAELAGARVHAVAPAGKVVVTVEGPTSQDVADAVLRMQVVPGVLSAALVYQCGDTLASMNEEISDAEAGLR